MRGSQCRWPTASPSIVAVGMLATGLWASPSAAIAEPVEVPRTAHATDLGYVHVTGITGDNTTLIQCKPDRTRPSWGYMVGSMIGAEGSNGHASVESFYTFTGDIGSGTWLAGDGIMVQEEADPRVYSFGWVYFTGTSWAVSGPSATPWEHYLAVATFGGVLGECAAKANGVVIPFTHIDPIRAQYADLGGSESPIWTEQGTSYAGAGRTLDLDLYGGIALTKFWNHQGAIAARTEDSLGVPRSTKVCSAGNGAVCTWTSRGAARMRIAVPAMLAKYSEHSMPYLPPPMVMVMDLPE